MIMTKTEYIRCLDATLEGRTELNTDLCGAVVLRGMRTLMIRVNRVRLTCSAVLLAALAFSSSPALAQACTQTLTAGANVGSAVSNAAPGTTICLNNGNYSGFTLNNVGKSPRVTVRAVNPGGATFTGEVAFAGSTNGVTFDGINYRGISVTGASAHDLSFKNGDASPGAVYVDYNTYPNPNLLFENLTHINQDPTGHCWGGSVNCIGRPAGYTVFDAGRSNSNPVVIIRGAIISGGCADGIKLDTPGIVEYSIIKNRLIGSCANDPHVDALQHVGGNSNGLIVRYNYFYNNSQVIGFYDEVNKALIEHNVFDPGPSEPRQCQIELYSDSGSIVRNNTIIARGSNGRICLDKKSSQGAGVNTQVYNNIALGLSTANGSTASVNTNNLFSGSGLPVFAGACAGAVVSGTSWMQCALASGSAGKNAGTDGKDVGTNYFTGVTGGATLLLAPTNLIVN